MLTETEIEQIAPCVRKAQGKIKDRYLRAEKPLPASKRVIHENVVYTLSEAAALVVCSPDSLMRRFRDGKIRATRAFGEWRVRGSELLKAAV